eukprot:TRINITY_DN9710_c0_g1_i1.p1 TRINITY_DN9710_c0_g1~~TRINITY_DN9710_c0_g1_i1.p1  ORF type:complete len:446 (-),score=86.97 TRINITY_DN9710_c0_g1_i1:19-1356(-)
MFLTLLKTLLSPKILIPSLSVATLGTFYYEQKKQDQQRDQLLQQNLVERYPPGILSISEPSTPFFLSPLRYFRQKLRFSDPDLKNEQLLGYPFMTALDTLDVIVDKSDYPGRKYEPYVALDPLVDYEIIDNQRKAWDLEARVQQKRVKMVLDQELGISDQTATAAQVSSRGGKSRLRFDVDKNSYEELLKGGISSARQRLQKDLYNKFEIENNRFGMELVRVMQVVKDSEKLQQPKNKDRKDYWWRPITLVLDLTVLTQTTEFGSPLKPGVIEFLEEVHNFAEIIVFSPYYKAELGYMLEFVYKIKPLVKRVYDISAFFELEATSQLYFFEHLLKRESSNTIIIYRDIAKFKIPNERIHATLIDTLPPDCNLKDLTAGFDYVAENWYLYHSMDRDIMHKVVSDKFPTTGHLYSYGKRRNQILEHYGAEKNLHSYLPKRLLRLHIA